MSETNDLKVIDERIVLEKNFRIFGTFEEPLFLAKDVAMLIDNLQPTQMVEVVDDSEKLMCSINISGQNRQVWMITEDGLYEVLMLSRKPVAKDFKKQVKEILKTIRKTGGYVASNRESEFVAKYFPNLPEDAKLLLVQNLVDKTQQLQAERDEAIRTKAMISDKKTATALGRVGGYPAYVDWVGNCGLMSRQTGNPAYTSLAFKHVNMCRKNNTNL